MLGDNLSNYRNVITLSAKTPEELDRKLNEIRLPYTVMGMYAMDGIHYIKINTTKRLRIIKQENKDGSIK